MNAIRHSLRVLHVEDHPKRAQYLRDVTGVAAVAPPETTEGDSYDLVLVSGNVDIGNEWFRENVTRRTAPGWRMIRLPGHVL